jgi:hypothetical protein
MARLFSRWLAVPDIFATPVHKYFLHYLFARGFMNKCRYLFLSALAALLFLFQTPSSAQTPNQQFGIGGTVSSGRIIGGIISAGGGGGIYGVYAISPAVHINAAFSLSVVNLEEINTTSVGFGVGGKFLFGGNNLFHPFASASFGFSSESIEGTSRSRPGIGVGVGAEYFANRNFGAFISMSIISVQFGDQSGSSFGLGGNATIGLEWFF